MEYPNNLICQESEKRVHWFRKVLKPEEQTGYWLPFNVYDMVQSGYPLAGFCHDSTHKNAGQCGCTFYYPNDKWISRQQKKLGPKPQNKECSPIRVFVPLEFR